MNRRHFLASTAIGASALALPAAASIQKAPPEFEATCIVATLLSIFFKQGTNCLSWPTVGQVPPERSIIYDCLRDEFSIPARFPELHFRCHRLAHVFYEKMQEHRKRHVLFVMQPDYTWANTYDRVTVQSKVHGDRIDFAVHWRTFDEAGPLPMLF